MNTPDLYEIFLVNPSVCIDSRKATVNSIFFALTRLLLKYRFIKTKNKIVSEHFLKYKISGYDYITIAYLFNEIFIADEYDAKTLEIKLDYVIPQYRDFKIGNFVFESQKDYFLDSNYEGFIAFTENKKHIDYVKKMGFVEDSSNKGSYHKSI